MVLGDAHEFVERHLVWVEFEGEEMREGGGWARAGG